MKKFLAILALVPLFACTQRVQLLPQSSFEAEFDGKQTDLHTLKGGDITLQFTTLGARVVSIWTPDKKGNMADVCPGYDNIDMYINNPGERFLGPIVGPVANRVEKGTFTLDGEVYSLPLNNDGNTLHGGFVGIDMLVWDVEELTDSSAVLSVVHPDGLEGWPGNLTIKVQYLLTSANEFRIDYSAVTDKATPVNLSSHTFFNLTGNTSKSILDHIMYINGGRSTAIDNLLIPTGEIVSLDGSPLDFREPKAIGLEVNADDDQIRNGYGYDHNWCLDRETADGIELAARVVEPVSGRTLEVWTDQPGLQFYCGNFFTGKELDKFGNPIGYRCALALETQKWPDSPNHPDTFQDITLRPGETYTQTCIYKFGVEK